ncbi:MAG: phosphoribosylglycinamide formyltransferase [Rikenellaceae bacterium]|jgi:phosphoribosylglycinamide formyltransferase-1|nr:phosphoribosylglycinamide formyltransferase [Rikenellaceae bacterium]
MKNIAIFASGSGSNAEQIIRRFEHSPLARVAVVLANRPDALVLERAVRLNVPAEVFSREDFYDNGRVTALLRQYRVDYIVLAGFLWLVPEGLVRDYPGRIVNIHPALLPKYGGKGMYGYRVHRAVIESGDRESGITIHRVNEVYDSGDILLQETVEVTPEDTPDSLAAKIHALEHEFYPWVVEREISKI